MGSWVGTSVGALVGSLLEPGFGLLDPGAGGVSLGGASTSPSACWGWSLVSPFDLLVLAALCVVPSLSLYLGQFWLSSVSLPVFLGYHAYTDYHQG